MTGHQRKKEYIETQAEWREEREQKHVEGTQQQSTTQQQKTQLKSPSTWKKEAQVNNESIYNVMNAIGCQVREASDLLPIVYTKMSLDVKSERRFIVKANCNNDQY